MEFRTKVSIFTYIFRDENIVLNRVNIEKSALYLNNTNYMDHIKSRHDPSEEELKGKSSNRCFWNKRKAEGDKNIK